MNEDGVMLSFAITAGAAAIAGLLCCRKALVPFSGVLALAEELDGNRQIPKRMLVRNVGEQKLKSFDEQASNTHSLANLSAALANTVNVEPAVHSVSPAEETSRPILTSI